AVVEENTIHHAAFQRAPIEFAAGLDHEREIALAAQPVNYTAQVGAAAGTVERQHLYTARFEQLASFGSRGACGYYQHIARGAAHHFGIQRQAQQGIHHDAQERTAARMAGAVAEQAIVGEYGADAGEDGIVIVADFLHVSASAFAGNPAAIVVGGGDLAIQRDRCLQGDQRAAGAHEMQEWLVEFLGFDGELRRDLDFDTGLAQSGEALSGDQGVGVCDGRYDARYAGLDQRIDAGRRAALVRAGLQVEIECGTSRLLAGLREGDNFGVVETGVGVEAAAYDFAIAHQDRSYQRIGAGQRP